MAYFNHAYQKAFYMGNVDSGGASAVNLKTAGNTSALGVNDFGVFDCSDYVGMTSGDVTTLAQSTGSGATLVGAGAYSSGKILLAQGAWNSTDTLGGNAHHGGYKESIKSKDIQFRYITRMNEIASQAAANQVVEFKVCGATSSQSCFPCGSDPQIRIDIKGADALRMLNHNAYRNVDIGAICHCCGDDGDYLDPKMVLATWASNIKKDPILSKLIDTSDNSGATTSFFGHTTLGPAGAMTPVDPDTFISATGCAASWDETDCAVIRLNLGVVDTTFGTCSFDTRDWTNVEPLTATMELLAEDGKSCDTSIIVSADGTGTSVAPAQVIGDGNTVLKDILLTQRYLQQPYNQGLKDSARFRTIEGSADILSNVPTNKRYYQFQLQHTVPRFNNPTGVFDNDQYLYTVYTDTLDAAQASPGDVNGNIAALSTIWDAIAAGANITNTTL